MSETVDQRKSRFAEYVKVQAFGSRFIDRANEKRILEEGVTRFDLSLDESRQIMLGVGSNEGYSFESDADRRMADILQGYANNGKVDCRQFGDAVSIHRRFCGNELSEDEAKKRVKRIMESEGLRPRSKGLLSGKRWYNKIDLG